MKRSTVLRADATARKVRTMPDPSTDPLGAGALGVLLTALGLSSASGLRAYFPLLVVAIGSDIPTSGGHSLVTLSKPFQALGTWWFVALLAILVVGEFAVDKVPVLDHASDIFHTIVRPISGAVIMAGTSNPLSDRNIWVAAIVGAALALTVHTTKAVTRPAVTATTAGIGNPVISVVEDGFVAIVSILAVLAPVLAIVLLLILAVVIVFAVRAGWRKLRASRQGPALATGEAYPGGSPDVSSTRRDAPWPEAGGLS